MLVELITDPTGQRRRRTLDIVYIMRSSHLLLYCAVHLKAHQCEPWYNKERSEKDEKCWRFELRWLIVIDHLLSSSLISPLPHHISALSCSAIGTCLDI